MAKEISIRKGLFKLIKKMDGALHLVLIATKPDIIKQAPLILELKKRGESYMVVHSGQHHDWNLSKGLEREFGIVPDINLNVEGRLYEQQSQIISRLGRLLYEMKKIKRNIVPYTYGDTTTAVAGGIASFANKISVAHVEAGLRTLTPPKKMFLRLLHPFDVKEYLNELMENKNWCKGSYEPYPEQFDTRAAAPSAGLHFAPHPINEEHLLDEGFPQNRIFTVGNPIVDAIAFARKNLNKSNIFEKYPKLEEGNFIRFCAHRRENVSSFQRFKSIFLAMESLIKEGKNVLFISLRATEKALDEFNLKRRILSLANQYTNFIYSPVWPSYIDVIAALGKCSVVATDSGSMQEETNSLGIPGVVLRFNSDRPEAIFNGSNILAPPIREDIIFKIIKEVYENDSLNRKMRKTKKIYGKNVGKNIVENVKDVLKREPLFNFFEHEKMGLNKLEFWEGGELEW